jgi:hypothetical protein
MEGQKDEHHPLMRAPAGTLRIPGKSFTFQSYNVAKKG